MIGLVPALVENANTLSEPGSNLGSMLMFAPLIVTIAVEFSANFPNMLIVPAVMVAVPPAISSLEVPAPILIVLFVLTVNVPKDIKIIR